jgi:hypothetical protein
MSSEDVKPDVKPDVTHLTLVVQTQSGDKTTFKGHSDSSEALLGTAYCVYVQRYTD